MRKLVLVIGAGQAGLAAGYHLKKARAPFVIVDSHKRIGDSWRARYDSLTLFTPRQFSALPSLPFGGNRELYPSRDEFAAYLESYASHFDLPVLLGGKVKRLSKVQDGNFHAVLDTGDIVSAAQVIVATGGFQRAIVPEIVSKFGREVLQLTADTYRNPNQLPDGPVLVVGDGPSGRDIAVDARKLQPVILATGKPRRIFPERLLGKSIWWWLDLTGILKASEHSRVGQKLKRSDAFPDRGRSNADMARRGIHVVPRLTDAHGSEARFSDGTATKIRTVIWAAGYRDDTAWLAVPGATTPEGAFLHDAGVSPVKGIYYVGRPWQFSRASALILGAGRDAERIVRRLLADRDQLLADD